MTILILQAFLLFVYSYSLSAFNVQYRRIGIEDIEHVAELITDAFVPSWSWVPQRLYFKMEQMKLLSDRFQKFSQQNHLMQCALLESKVVAYVEVGMSGFPEINKDSSDALLQELRAKKQLPLIGNLVVEKRYRRLGIGRELMNQAEQIAHYDWKFQHILCGVDPKNKNAITLYENLRYKEQSIDIKPNKYTKRILLSKELVFSEVNSEISNNQ